MGRCIAQFPGAAGTGSVFDVELPGKGASAYIVVMGGFSKTFWSEEAALDFAKAIAESGWDTDSSSSPVVPR